MGRRKKDRRVIVERTIPAPAQKIFDVLADPSMHPVIDGSGTVRKASADVPERLALGSEFGMSMKVGTPYKVNNKVVEFEEGRRIAWRHVGRQLWRYELEPVEGGTLVRETFDYAKALTPLGIELAGFPKRNRRGMEKTLERIESEVT